MEIREVKKKQANRLTVEQYDDKIKKLRKDHDKLVKGKFEFVDAQGGWFEFAYRFFKDDILTTYRFVHGEICEIPMGLVKHINNTKRKIRKFAADLTNTRGVPSSVEVQSRVTFVPSEML